jgi:hypothetical protein
MFQSYTYKYKGYDQAIDQCYEITIFDPDFGEEMVMAVGMPSGTWVVEASAAGVIKLYSSKDYSINQIAKNLWLLFEFHQRQYSSWTIKKQIKWCLECLPEYQPYHADIQMLMLFS